MYVLILSDHRLKADTEEMVGSRQAFTVDGSVVRITMRNFMTYKNETFWPGPNFNVAVGPNGSGKSSILTALCIAGGLLAVVAAGVVVVVAVIVV